MKKIGCGFKLGHGLLLLDAVASLRKEAKKTNHFPDRDFNPGGCFGSVAVVHQITIAVIRTSGKRPKAASQAAAFELQ
jgi:hypothetical protein